MEPQQFMSPTAMLTEIRPPLFGKRKRRVAMFTKRALLITLSLTMVAGLLLSACATPTPRVVEKEATKDWTKYSELKNKTDAHAEVDISASASRGSLGSEIRAKVSGAVYKKGTKNGLKDRKLITVLLRVEKDATGKTSIVQVDEKEVTTGGKGDFEVELKDSKKASGGGEYRVRIVDDETEAWIVIPVK